jgi:WD40 repeat protein
MASNKIDRAVRYRQKRHKRLAIFIERAGIVATASVSMLLAWGNMVGDQQQLAKDLAITPKFVGAKWLAEDRAGAPAAPIFSHKDGTVRQWEATSGRAIGEPLQGHQGRVNSAAYSADGSRIMSAGMDGTVRQWDAKSGRAIGEPLQGHQDPMSY